MFYTCFSSNTEVKMSQIM